MVSLRSQKGYSLIELMIATAISALALYLLSSSVADIFSDSRKILKDSENQSEMNIIMGMVQRSILRSDITLFAFHGDGNATTPLARMLIPHKNLCSDHSSACSGASGVIWATYNNRQPSIPISCSLNSTTLIFSTANSEQGPFTISGTEAVVSSSDSDYPSGRIPLAAGSLIALLDEPLGVLFRVTANPLPYNPGYDAATQTFADVSFGGNPDCRKLASYNSLFRITVAPVLAPHSGVTLPTAATVRSAFGVFPTRLVPVELFNFGVKDTSTNTYLQVKRCDSSLVCNETVVETAGVTHLNIQYVTGRLFSGQTTLKNFSLTSSPHCTAASCLQVTWNIANAYYGTGETDTVMNSSQYSFIKSEQLRTISFFVESQQVSSGNEAVRKNVEVYHATSF